MKSKINLKELGYGQDAFYEVEGHDVFTMNTSEEHDMSLDRIYISEGGHVIKEVIVDGEVISRASFMKEEIIAISEKILERDPEEQISIENFTWKDFHVGAEHMNNGLLKYSIASKRFFVELKNNIAVDITSGSEIEFFFQNYVRISVVEHYDNGYRLVSYPEIDMFMLLNCPVILL